MRFLSVFRSNALAGVDLKFIFLLVFIKKFIFKASLVDKLPYLQVNHIVELSPPHPVREHDHQGHAAYLHVIGGFIKVSLLESEMILLSVKVALGGEIGDTLFIYIVADLPLFAFAKLVNNPYNCTMAIRCEIFFTYLPKDPPACTIFTVNKLVDFDLIVVEVDRMRVMLCDKVLEIELKLISN